MAGISSPRTSVASISTASATPTPKLLNENDLRGGKRADDHRQQECRAGDQPARAL